MRKALSEDKTPFRRALANLHELSLRLLEAIEQGDTHDIKHLTVSRGVAIQDLDASLSESSFREEDQAKLAQEFERLRAMGRQIQERLHHYLGLLQQKRLSSAGRLRQVRGYRPNSSSGLTTRRLKA